LLEAARRELLEETGYAANAIEPLMTGPASSGTTSEIVTFFRASAYLALVPGGGRAKEDITVHEVPLAEAYEWLADKNHSGLLIDPKVYAGLYFLWREV
jgi:ADP-ribose pyrophosphatase